MARASACRGVSAARPICDRVERAGVRGFSVVNHMLLPKAFGPTSVEDDYWHLREHVQVWDVSTSTPSRRLKWPRCRTALVQWMTPRRPSKRERWASVFMFRSSTRMRRYGERPGVAQASGRIDFGYRSRTPMSCSMGEGPGRRGAASMSRKSMSRMSRHSPCRVRGRKTSWRVTLSATHVRKIKFFQICAGSMFDGTPPARSRDRVTARQGGFEIYLNGSGSTGERGALGRRLGCWESHYNIRARAVQTSLSGSRAGSCPMATR